MLLRWILVSLLSTNVCLLTTPAPCFAEAAEIRLGMSTVLTGPAAELGQAMRAGVLAGLERLNRAGGIAGRKVRLICLDDGYEPARTAPNMRTLIETEKVLAVIGNVGTPTAIVAIPIANEQKTLFFAAFTGAGMLRKSPPDRYVINYRASYAEETGAMIEALIQKAGLKPTEVAFFTQRDGYGDAGFIGGVAALKRHGLTDEHEVLHARYERNSLSVETALAEMLTAERTPRAIVMVGAYAPCARFIRLAHEAELDAIFLNVSFVGSSPLAQELGSTPVKVIVTQVVPYPGSSNVPIVSEYRQDLRLIDPTAKPDFGSLEGYIAARILGHALARSTGPLTRESIVDQLESLGEFSIGTGEPLGLSKDDHQASHKVWPTVLGNGQFVPFEWDAIRSLLN